VTKNEILREKQEGQKEKDEEVEKDDEKVEEKENSNVISMKSKFSRGAIAGIFSSVMKFMLNILAK